MQTTQGVEGDDESDFSVDEIKYCQLISVDGKNSVLMKKQRKEFNVIIEKDEDGFFVADVPELPGCHTQAKSLDGLMKRVEEVISLCLEAQRGKISPLEFIGIQRLSV